jgi:hypothetical protein
MEGRWLLKREFSSIESPFTAKDVYFANVRHLSANNQRVLEQRGA